jgi:hypothetical protein
MRKIITPTLQKIADYIISKIESSENEVETNFWLNQGYYLLSFCTTLDIELK